MNEIKNWYAVYTRPRWEKRVVAQLEKKGLEHYCPLTKIRRRWSDRYKVVEEPLFKSYVFVCIPEEDKGRIRLTDGVVNFVYWQGVPAIIKPAEIETIKRFLMEFEEVQARPLQVQPGERVRIKAGLLMDAEGVVQWVKGNRVYVQLETLGYELSAQFEKKNVEPSAAPPPAKK